MITNLVIYLFLICGMNISVLFPRIFQPHSLLVINPIKCSALFTIIRSGGKRITEGQPCIDAKPLYILLYFIFQNVALGHIELETENAKE